LKLKIHFLLQKGNYINYKKKTLKNHIARGEKQNWVTSKRMADQNLPYTIPHNTNARHAHIDALDQSNYIIILNIVSKLRKRKKEEHNIRCSHMRILLREENDIITASIQC